MTSKTQAKLAGPIKYKVHGKRAYLYVSKHQYIGEVDEQYADAVVHACNLHEELVAACESAQLWLLRESEDRNTPSCYAEPLRRIENALAKCQESTP